MLLDKTLLVTEANGGVIETAGFGCSKVFVTLPKGATAATLKVETGHTKNAIDTTLIDTASATAEDIRLGVFAIDMPAHVREFVKITPSVTGATGFVAGIAPVYEQEAYISPANQALIK